MFRFVTAAALFSFALGQRYNLAYEDCGSQATILSAQMEPCNSDPCVIKRGVLTKIHFALVSEQDSRTARLSAKFKLFGFMVPIPGIMNDLCKGAIQCPVVKGKTYRGVVGLVVPWFMVPMKSTVQFSIVGDKGVSVCAKTDIVIQ